MSRPTAPSLPPVDIHVHGPVDRSAVLALRSLTLAEARTALASDPGPLSVGLHPWDVAEATLEDDLRELSLLLDDPRVVAVGEAGLDRRRGPALPLQRAAFLAQARWAEESGRPILLHCVGAASDLIEIRTRSRFRTPWILHGWTGSAAQTDDLVRKTDLVFSFGAAVVEPSPARAAAVAIPPSDRILIETDASAIGIERVEAEVARLRNQSPGQLRTQLHATWNRLFGF